MADSIPAASAAGAARDRSNLEPQPSSEYEALLAQASLQTAQEHRGWVSDVKAVASGIAPLLDHGNRHALPDGPRRALRRTVSKELRAATEEAGKGGYYASKRKMGEITGRMVRAAEAALALHSLTVNAPRSAVGTLRVGATRAQRSRAHRSRSRRRGGRTTANRGGDSGDPGPDEGHSSKADASAFAPYVAAARAAGAVTSAEVAQSVLKNAPDAVWEQYRRDGGWS